MAIHTCEFCGTQWCLCQGPRCPECKGLRRRDPSKSVANLPFIAAMQDKAGNRIDVVLEPMD